MSFGWSDISTVYQLSIILAGLIIVTIFGGFIRLWYTKRRSLKHQKLEDVEKTRHDSTRTRVRQSQLGEGDLFGVRALEKGFFGGVSQATPSTTAANSPQTLFGSPGTGLGIPTESFESLDLAKISRIHKTRSSDETLSHRAANARGLRSYNDEHPSVDVNLGTAVSHMSAVPHTFGLTIQRSSTTIKLGGPILKSPERVYGANDYISQSAGRTVRAISPGSSNSSVISCAGSIESSSSSERLADSEIGSNIRKYWRKSEREPLSYSRFYDNKACTKYTPSKPPSFPPIPYKSPNRQSSSSRLQNLLNTPSASPPDQGERTLRRATDSLKHKSHSRVHSRESVLERRRDLQYFDPAMGRKDGVSVKGRAVDFDQRRESPFAEVMEGGNTSREVLRSKSQPVSKSRARSTSSASRIETEVRIQIQDYQTIFQQGKLNVSSERRRVPNLIR